MTFNDVVKLIPKSWFDEEHIAHVNAINCAYLEVLDTVSCMSVRRVSIDHFTETANSTKAMMVPDCKNGRMLRIRNWYTRKDEVLTGS